MIMNQKDIDNMETQSSLLCTISEHLGIIDSTMAPIKQLQKLSGGSRFSAATFATSEPEQVVEIAVDMAETLRILRNEMKRIHGLIDNLSEDFYCPAQPCLATEIKELKAKFYNHPRAAR